MLVFATKRKACGALAEGIIEKDARSKLSCTVPFRSVSIVSVCSEADEGVSLAAMRTAMMRGPRTSGQPVSARGSDRTIKVAHNRCGLNALCVAPVTSTPEVYSKRFSAVPSKHTNAPP